VEPLTSATAGRRGWGPTILLLAVLLSGPQVASTLISGLSSIVTLPLTGSVHATANRFEVFNTELLLVYVLAALGLNLLLQTGLMSIGHSALFGLGAYVTAILTVSHGWSFWLALPVAGLACGLLGLVLGVPALRLGLFTLAMVTVGYSYVASDLALSWQGVTGGGNGLSGVSMPKPFDGLEAYYWLLAAAVVVAYVAAHNVLRSPMGRAARAIEDSTVAAQSLGVSPYRTKLRAFSLSSVFAGLAGGLYAPLLGLVAPDSFTVNLSILLLLMVLLGGAGTLGGPLLGALLLFRIPLEVQRVTQQPGEWSLLVYGLVLLISVYVVPRGLLSTWWWLRARVLGRLRRRAARPAAARGTVAVSTLVRRPPAAGEAPLLAVDGVTKSLGGVRVLAGLDLTVTAGAVHALIGPNGSGKTTLLNVVSGFLAPDSGRVLVRGEQLESGRPELRAARGVARTFQTPLVFETVSCLENVLVALDHSRHCSSLAYGLRWPAARREERAAVLRASALLDAVGLADRAAAPAAALPPGERRLLELARVLALEPSLVLMDEPAAGLTAGEIDELSEVIRSLSAGGVGVLLVEHHVEMVMRLADVVTVIDYGRQIACGPPDEVRSDPAVLTAYLGEQPSPGAAAQPARAGPA